MAKIRGRGHLIAEAAGIPLYFTGVRHFYH
jgi:hypothetical protein